LVLEQKVCPVLAVALFGSVVDHVSHTLGSSISRSGTIPVVDNVQDQMHLPQTNAKGREYVDTGLSMPPFSDLQQFVGVLACDG
jgi:hypothetical protein